MKVVFLCGAMEAGRDGVGDYVRRLSAELIRQGHHPAVVALNDRYIQDVFFEIQKTEGTIIPVLRIPENWSNKRRYGIANKFITDFGPEILSLQFVPYSFHVKGIPYHMLFGLKHILTEKRFKFHVMFHEMWLDTPVGVLQRITAIAQKMLVARLVKMLKPAIVNVSIPFNQIRLKKMGITSAILNLFGNIYKEGRMDVPLKTEWRKHIDGISLLYFGAPPKGRFLKELTDKLEAFCEVSRFSFTIFLACGRSGAKDRFVEELHVKLDVFGCEIVDCGFLEIDMISSLMTQCTAGISRSSANLLGKSGGTVAMLEHGLPVWMPKWDGSDKLGLGFREELIFADLNSAIATMKKHKYQPILEDVAKDFLKQFNSPQVT
ncbi:glycosyltransferase [Pedobacter psychroterrae]|uniref:Glycosyltransferase involved in cell wall biosynthesis n=1 Tax=Pedobacter psychroterrae TaxID=2530453 RepID=A0A4R0NRK1_9SPHI|nr:glycosyltransferase family 4 protein [Pedobacter psychroterrae]TCD02678.1 hypothetical protein EZ437_01440 [Pedobacter psychroterrae]